MCNTYGLNLLVSDAILPSCNISAYNCLQRISGKYISAIQFAYINLTDLDRIFFNGNVYRFYSYFEQNSLTAMRRVAIALIFVNLCGTLMKYLLEVIPIP